VQIQPDKAEKFEDEEEEGEVSLLASGGGKAVEFLNTLRGGSGTFYVDALNSFWWYMCDQKVRMEFSRMEFSLPPQKFARMIVTLDASPRTHSLSYTSVPSLHLPGVPIPNTPIPSLAGRRGAQALRA
jgi:hypothetical protein